MAVLTLLLSRKFRESFLQGREIKYRIVAKPSHASWRFQNFSIDVVRNHCQDLPFAHQRNGANKMRGALFANFILHFAQRSEEHTSELQSRFDLVCRLLLEKKKKKKK